MMEVNRGLSRVNEIYNDRSGRVKELRTADKKILGYTCLYPPLEIMNAFNIVPYRIFGDMEEPISKGDSVLPTVVCPFIRSYVDLGLKGKYDFLDGVVGSHACDIGEKAPHYFQSRLNYPYYHFIDVPHRASKSALNLFKTELKNFQKSLELYTGSELSPDKLNKSIDEYNQQRSLIRELYGMNKQDPPLVSGPEILKTIVALMSIPVHEGNELIKQVLGEVKNRKDGPPGQPARLLVWGSIIDATPLIELIEDVGANVVIDDTCVGTRAYWVDVDRTDDPLEGLAYRYLINIKCPRTFREAAKSGKHKDYKLDLEHRFSYLEDMAKEWKVDGVILQSVKYCDTHGYEVPLLQDYFENKNLPSIYLEHDYSGGALASLRTRIQAFLEMIA